MVRWKGNKIYTDYHEWAWSKRSEGFRVYAILEDGTVKLIGETTKRPAIYNLPEGTIAVLRHYISNNYYESIYIYTPDGKQYEVHETENYAIPTDLDDKIKEAIIKWLDLEGD